MPKFSERSKHNLSTCSPLLRCVFDEVIKHRDCAVICGHRGQEAQDKAFAEGKSKLRWPLSEHNQQPSRAVDVVPYPIDWSDITRFRMFGNFVLGVAAWLGLKLEWGGNWETFKDYPHYQELNY